MKTNLSILFLGKQQDVPCSKALEFCRLHFSDIQVYLGSWGDPYPKEASEWEGDYVISYLSRWVVPEVLLRRARIASFNFHPGSPDYPGIGCLNFALYNEAPEYGVTCHHMEPAVDTGSIIAVRRFPILPNDTVASLLARTHDYQLALFYEVMSELATGKPLPASVETWGRKPYTRKEFNLLGKVTPDMSPEEVARRVRATSFGVYQPIVELHGFRFQYVPETPES